MVARVVLDLETCSTLNLPTVGAAAYFEHPTTQVPCAGFAIDKAPIVVWRPGEPVPVFPDDAIFVAHNYLFEFHAWELLLTPRYGWPPVPGQDRWSCTMARALYHALPASLDHLCEALHLAIKKDDSSRRLMLQMARPRTREPLTWWHETDPSKLIELMFYCIQDVAAERLVDQVLPELSPDERRVFEVDGRINRRGLGTDLDLVTRMIDLAGDELRVLDQHMRNLTRRQVHSCSQVGMLQTWLAMDQQCHVPDLRKHTVAEALAAVPHASPKARAALLTRQEAARASTKKLNAMIAGRSHDGRVRGLFQYGGAGRTLRWAGRRVQPQNFPRGTIKHVDAALTLMKRYDAAPADLTALFEDSAMGVLASCLRSCFVAAPGHLFAVADLAQIEARVVAWLAGQQDILDVFARGDDAYTYAARQQGSDNRQFGKVLVLACGFGMGSEKFRDTAAAYGVTLTLPQAIDAVWDWRQNNDDIVHFWWDVGNAAAEIAGGYDGKTIWAGRVRLRRSRKAMRIRLPSGRDLIYHNVGLERDAKGRAQIVFMGVDPKTKQWSKQRTYGGKLVENITQATARDVMAASMVVLDAAGVPLVGTVHDEVLAEPRTADAKVTLQMMLDAMRATPAWAPGLPLAATGWIGERYRKD